MIQLGQTTRKPSSRRRRRSHHDSVVQNTPRFRFLGLRHPVERREDHGHQVLRAHPHGRPDLTLGAHPAEAARPGPRDPRVARQLRCARRTRAGATARGRSPAARGASTPPRPAPPSSTWTPGSATSISWAPALQVALRPAGAGASGRSRHDPELGVQAEVRGVPDGHHDPPSSGVGARASSARAAPARCPRPACEGSTISSVSSSIPPKRDDARVADDLVARPRQTQ